MAATSNFEVAAAHLRRSHHALDVQGHAVAGCLDERFGLGVLRDEGNHAAVGEHQLDVAVGTKCELFFAWRELARDLADAIAKGNAVLDVVACMSAQRLGLNWPGECSGGQQGHQEEANA